MASSSSSSVQTPLVFINVRGGELRKSFVSNLGTALRRDRINIYMDENETRGEDLSVFFKREESRVALAIISRQYTESRWCLDELVKIMECVDLKRLVVVPIFYKVKTGDVQNLEGEFGNKFWELAKTCEDGNVDKWRKALKALPTKLGLTLRENSDEVEFIERIVREVIRVVNNVLMNLERQIPIDNPSVGNDETTEAISTKAVNESRFGIETCLKLGEKLGFDGERTLNIGVVGTSGIGKTTLRERSYEKWRYNFMQCIFTRVFSTRKELYFAFCDNPVLLDDGKKETIIFWLEKASGKNCMMLSAMNLSIIRGEDPRYWQLITLPESRFERVAELLQVCWFEIRARTDTHVLSPRTRYSAYIVFKTKHSCYGFDDVAIEAKVRLVGHKACRRSLCFDVAADEQFVKRGKQRRNLMKPQERGDGWMEIEHGNFFNKMNSNEIKIRALEIKELNWKGGLIIQGIEFRPTKFQ